MWERSNIPFALDASWTLGPPMGNKQSSQRRRSEQYQHHAASNAAIRRSSSAPSGAFPGPPYAPSPAAPPPPYPGRDASAPPLPPIPDEQQIAETNPFRMPTPRRTQSHGAGASHLAPRRSQLLAGTGHGRMPTVPATVEEAPPMPMPEPHSAPGAQVQFPVPTVSSTVRAEPLVRRNSREDPLTMLRKYDTVIIVCLTYSGSSSC